jgi:hypothetical protein
VGGHRSRSRVRAAPTQTRMSRRDARRGPNGARGVIPHDAGRPRGQGHAPAGARGRHEGTARGPSDSLSSERHDWGQSGRLGCAAHPTPQRANASPWTMKTTRRRSISTIGERRGLRA